MYTCHCIPYPRFVRHRKPVHMGLQPPHPPRPRKRQLTPPLPPKDNFWSLPQKKTPQTGSTLFTKLPLEIRRLIWKQTVGEMTIHLIFSRRPDPMPMRRWIPQCRLLSLLLTCRQVYSEAIDFLYSSNTFAIDLKDSSFLLDKVIRPERFSQISSIRLTWWTNVAGTISMGHYATVWNILASMPGLKELRVELEAARFPEEVEMLELASVVKQPKLYRIFLSWPGPPVRDIPDAPHCEVTRVRENWRSDEQQVWLDGFVMNI